MLSDYRQYGVGSSCKTRQCLWVSCGKFSVLVVIGLASDGKIHASHGMNLSGIGEIWSLSLGKMVLKMCGKLVYFGLKSF